MNNKIITKDLNSYKSTFNDIRDDHLSLYEFGNGNECATYIPENVHSNTKIMVYYPGARAKADLYSGGQTYENLLIQDYLLQDNSDSIVLMPHALNKMDRMQGTIEMIDIVKEQYNLTSDNVQFSGFSLGAEAALESTAKYIEQNPEIGPQVCVTVDGYSNFLYNPKAVTNQVSEKLNENGTILIAIESRTKNTDHLKSYVDAGINVIRAEYQGDQTTDIITPQGIKTATSSYHSAINQHYIKDGISDFTNGTSLPSNGYKYQVYDKNAEDGKGAWIDIDVNEINTYQKMNNYFGNSESVKNPGVVLTVNSQLSGKNVSADLEILKQWSNNLSTVNDSAIDILNTLKSCIKSLSSCFDGEFSKGFIEDSSKIANDNQAIHNEMKNLCESLNVVASTMSQQ